MIKSHSVRALLELWEAAVQALQLCSGGIRDAASMPLYGPAERWSKLSDKCFWTRCIAWEENAQCRGGIMGNNLWDAVAQARHFAENASTMAAMNKPVCCHWTVRVLGVMLYSL